MKQTRVFILTPSDTVSAFTEFMKKHHNIQLSDRAKIEAVPAGENAGQVSINDPGATDIPEPLQPDPGPAPRRK